MSVKVDNFTCNERELVVDHVYTCVCVCSVDRLEGVQAAGLRDHGTRSQTP